MSTDFRAQTMRVALVDAYSAGRHLVPALQRLGVECVHVRSLHPDVLLGKLQVPDGFADDLRHDGDVAATVSVLRQWGIGSVLAAGESGVELADRLSAELGTPGNGMSRPTSRRNKYDMVLALRDAGMVHAITVVSSKADEIVEWAETVTDFPVVLKPLASGGRDNVTVCHSPEEIRAAHKQIMTSTDRQGRTNAAVLAQEFLDGDEYFINTVSRDGRHHIVEIWRYHKPRNSGGPVMHEYSEPLAPDEPDARALSSYTHQVLDALEIRNGAAHAEVILTANGPVLVECAARIGGGLVPDILARALGANQIDLLALSVAEPDEFQRLAGSAYQLLRHIRFVNLINTTDHAVAPSHEAMAAIRALPSCAHVVMMHPEGHPLTLTVDFASQPGYAFLVSDDLAELRADYERLREIERDLYANSSR